MAVSLRSGKEIKTKSKGKVKIYGVSKTESKSIWTFEKKQIFLPSFLNFLIKLGFDEKCFEIKYFFALSRDEENEDSEIDNSYLENPFNCKYLDITYFNEELVTFKKGKLDIELIFFSQKLILIIRNEKRDSLKIGELISEFAEFTKFKSK